jgi:Nif-specific regulatory protein
MQNTLDISNHLKRHEMELEALSLIGRLLDMQTGQREMLSEVLLVLEKRLGMFHSMIMLLTPEGNELIVEAIREGRAAQGMDSSYRIGEGVTGSVVETGRTEIVPLVSKEPRFRNRIFLRGENETGDVSFICVPIVIGTTIVGTLSADMPPHDLDSLKERARVLEIVASLISYDVKSRRTAQLQRQKLLEDNQRLRDAVEDRFRPENLIGSSNAMRGVYKKIQQVAVADTTVLIRGESGTGKELVASAIHYAGRRSAKPLVKINCAALNESLLESELFGHERGAFTGALATRRGRIEEAEGGTLFLDEIGDFSPMIQVKLLRVLQEREYERVGSSTSVKSNVRIIAATNKDLEQGILDETFRQDLYYRINVFPIVLPPLRDRKDDILLLADHFVEKHAKSMEKLIRRISSSAINLMCEHQWPGNVRELENCIEHAILLSEDGVIHGRHLPPTLQMPGNGGLELSGSLKTRIQALERDMITDVLKTTRGNVAAAARQLGITPRMVRYKIGNLGIDLERFKNERN